MIYERKNIHIRGVLRNRKSKVIMINKCILLVQLQVKIPASIMNFEAFISNGTSKIYLGICNTQFFLSVIWNHYRTFFLGHPLASLALSSHDQTLNSLKSTDLSPLWSSCENMLSIFSSEMSSVMLLRNKMISERERLPLWSTSILLNSSRMD